ncbi:unnamed protein product [Meganyctiphanes norvegica]|uniref:C-type lectin domain-containing protein n=1 Tax=Meganyctiphanes norvegica TaxID=48144 RepID=A0AAV2R7R9_MEGNR
MKKLLNVNLVYIIMGCVKLGANSEYVSLSRDDLKFLIAEVANSNNGINCSLNFSEHKGAKDQLEVLTKSIQMIAETLTQKKRMVEECRDCFTLGSQTFVAFPTKMGSWYNAKAFCEERGFVMAEPRDPNKLAKHLRSLVDVEQNYYWTGARGDGTQINWPSGGIMDSSSKWWWPGHPGAGLTSGHCVIMVTHSNPNGYSALGSHSCGGNNYFLCEKV